MLLDNTLRGAVAAALLATAGTALAGPEMSGYDYGYDHGRSQKMYREYVEEPEVVDLEVVAEAPPVAVVPAVSRERVEVHVSVAGCSTGVVQPVVPVVAAPLPAVVAAPVPAIAVAPAPLLPPPAPLVRSYRYKGHPALAAPAPAVRHVHGPRPLRPGFY